MLDIKSILQNKSFKVGKSERADLLKFFIENIPDKNGNKYKPQFLAVKLSHLSKSDLYYFISVCKDILSRKGQVSMQKYFWWSIKSKV